jgi:hypothetical protein
VKNGSIIILCSSLRELFPKKLPVRNGNIAERKNIYTIGNDQQFNFNICTWKMEAMLLLDIG